MERFKHLSRDEEKRKIDPCPHDVNIISKESVPTRIPPGVKIADNVGVYHFVTNILNGKSHLDSTASLTLRQIRLVTRRTAQFA